MLNENFLFCISASLSLATFACTSCKRKGDIAEILNPSEKDSRGNQHNADAQIIRFSSAAHQEIAENEMFKLNLTAEGGKLLWSAPLQLSPKNSGNTTPSGLISAKIFLEHEGSRFSSEYDLRNISVPDYAMGKKIETFSLAPLYPDLFFSQLSRFPAESIKIKIQLKYAGLLLEMPIHKSSLLLPSEKILTGLLRLTEQEGKPVLQNMEIVQLPNQDLVCRVTQVPVPFKAGGPAPSSMERLNSALQLASGIDKVCPESLHKYSTDRLFFRSDSGTLVGFKEASGKITNSILTSSNNSEPTPQNCRTTTTQSQPLNTWLTALNANSVITPGASKKSIEIIDVRTGSRLANQDFDEVISGYRIFGEFLPDSEETAGGWKILRTFLPKPLTLTESTKGIQLTYALAVTFINKTEESYFGVTTTVPKDKFESGLKGIIPENSGLPAQFSIIPLADVERKKAQIFLSGNSLSSHLEMSEVHQKELSRYQGCQETSFVHSFVCWEPAYANISLVTLFPGKPTERLAVPCQAGIQTALQGPHFIQ